jgi:ArsR family transcriptional regulator
MADLDIRQSLLSFHLKTLKNAGLVQDRKDGRWVHYSINWSGLEELKQLISVLQTPQSGTPCCATQSNEPCGCHNS